MTNYLGGESIAGGKLKETGTIHWNDPNTGATNETGFTALPGGFRWNPGAFTLIGVYGYWWSVTVHDSHHSWSRGMYNNLSDVLRSENGKGDGSSVRCLKD